MFNKSSTQYAILNISPAVCTASSKLVVFFSLDSRKNPNQQLHAFVTHKAQSFKYSITHMNKTRSLQYAICAPIRFFSVLLLLLLLILLCCCSLKMCCMQLNFFVQVLHSQIHFKMRKRTVAMDRCTNKFPHYISHLSSALIRTKFRQLFFLPGCFLLFCFKN